jgi:serine/threonine protein kinase
VSEATDQYALGVVLYELITGKKPYSADTPAAIAILQATEPLPQPSKLVKGIPEEVEKVLYKALARDPQDRYENMVTYQKVLLSIAMNNKYDLDDQENGKRNYYKLNHDCETDNSTYDELTDLPNTQKSSFSSNSAESHEVGSNHGKQVQDQSEKYYGKFDMNADGLFYIDGPDENDSTGDNTNSSHNKQSQINSQAFSLIIFLGIAGGLFLSISTGLPVFVIIIVIIGLAFIFIPQLISQLFEEIKAFLIRLLIK